MTTPLLRWIEFGSDEWLAAADLRTRVFVGEQNVPPELELDAEDAVARHLVAEMDGSVVGTLRVLPYGDDALKIGRVAVAAELRGLGVGRAMMVFAVEDARARGASRVVLGSQTTVIPFYERLGFIAEGPEFLDAGIPHRGMTLRLASI